MADKPASPFQGLDKALLRSTRAAPPSEQSVDSSQEDQQASMEVKKRAGKVAGKSTSREVEKPASEPLLKVGYYFTQAEIDLVDELHHVLRRQHRVKVSKSDIIRIALAQLNADYYDNKDQSFLIREAKRRSRTAEA